VSSWTRYRCASIIERCNSPNHHTDVIGCRNRRWTWLYTITQSSTIISIYPTSNINCHTTVTDPVIQDKYINIDTYLRGQWMREATNIAGIHINIGHSYSQMVLALHHILSSQVQWFLDQNNLNALAFDSQRFIKYKQVVDTLGTAMIFVPEDWSYCDNEWNPKDQWYSLVRLKQYGNQYVTELRTPRGWYDKTSIIESIETVKKKS